MKILHIITSLCIGGAEVALYNRLKAMSSDCSNMQHLVVCFYHGPMVAVIRELGVEVVVVRGLVRGYDPVGFWQVYKIVQRFNPNIIHTALWAANMIGRALGTLLHVPVINELHGNIAHEGAVRNAVERWSCRWADKIVAVSQAVRVSYEEKIMAELSVRDRQCVAAALVTVVNGIDRQDLLKRVTAQPVSRVELGFADNDFVIGAIGRLEKIKSYDVLIRSVAVAISCHPGPAHPELVEGRPGISSTGSREWRSRLEGRDDKIQEPIPTIKVVLIGDGSERSRLERLAKELGLEAQVMFMGYRTDAYRLYSVFDCFALSSQSEGLSIALLEAVALGIPVISTHLGEEHDAVIHGKNGLLVPPNNIEAYAQGLLDLHQNRLVKSCNMTPLLGEFPFSLENVVAAYHRMYVQLSQ